jgi:putative glutamine amidotransferase
MLRVGIAACFFHADFQRPIFKGKTLLYLVEDVGNSLLREGAMPVLIPTLPAESMLSLREIVADLDGLVLQGGSDVAPESYGEPPLKPEWSGDATRDRYEIRLVEEFVRLEKPVLGLCRGLQLLNVAFKGTLYQDIATQVAGAAQHRNWEIYDNNTHEIEIEPDSRLAKLYPASRFAKVNSIHHQAIKDLAPDFQAEAFSRADRLIEAIRHKGPNYLVGVQWHPEFPHPSTLNPKPLLKEFLVEAQKKREERGRA